jgi:hypothetical protein
VDENFEEFRIFMAMIVIVCVVFNDIFPWFILVTGRGGCKLCKGAVDKGELKLAVMVQVISNNDYFLHS